MEVSGWKLGACIALGITVGLMLPPITLLLDGSLLGIVSLLVRATLGTILGVYGYLILFDVPRRF